MIEDFESFNNTSAMKTAFCLVLCIAVATAERCMSADDCSHETCDSSSTLSCLMGECTCTTADETGGFPGFGGEVPDFGEGAGGFGDFGGGELPDFGDLCGGFGDFGAAPAS